MEEDGRQFLCHMNQKMNSEIKYCNTCGLPFEHQDFGPINGPVCECWLWEAIENDPPEFFDPGECPEKLSDNSNSQITEYFNFLKQKYCIPSFSNAYLQPTLMNILVNLDQGNDIDRPNIEWLQKNGLYIVCAQVYYAKYQKYNDLWDLTKACKWYRYSNCPGKVIEIANVNINSSDLKAVSALITSLGGAYRDLRMFSQAFDCANRAIKHNPQSYQTYNLKGALHFEIREYEKGYQCFLKASELNSSQNIN